MRSLRWGRKIWHQLHQRDVMCGATAVMNWIINLIEISNGGLERQREGRGGKKQRKANEKSERDFWPRETFNISPFGKWIHCIRSCHWAIVTLASHTVRNVVNLGITQLNETWKIIYESENRQKALQLSLWQADTSRGKKNDSHPLQSSRWQKKALSTEWATTTTAAKKV